ncbi:hypothetical protein KCH_25100 [Kitasatospora cheerisanensis KCTC 2395]|uniref:Uncharacterized protein n=1 Tax=Kitasatospora cheerisanensis KCTC 2395 TaxID=1348663 RepID=A0A066YX85_9ACTN|nr:hypothetical protein KCH_25100 [Kitasatospora cheerisanensis KCTC 2395]
MDSAWTTCSSTAPSDGASATCPGRPPHPLPHLPPDRASTDRMMPVSAGKLARTGRFADEATGWAGQV